MTNENEEWVTVAEAGKIRGVSRQCIQWHIEEGNLIAQKFYGRWLVNKDSLANWTPKGPGEYKPREKKPKSEE